MRLPVQLPDLSGRVSRRDIALSPAVWMIVWGTFALFAVSTALVVVVGVRGVDHDRLIILSIGLGIVAGALSLMSPPAPDRPRTHAVLALTYIGPTLAMVAFGPQGSAAAITAAFAGPLTAVWMVERRQIAMHLTAATVILFIPSMLGLVDRATLVTCLYLVPVMWALCATCVFVWRPPSARGRSSSSSGGGIPSPAPATGGSSTRRWSARSPATAAPGSQSHSSPST